MKGKNGLLCVVLAVVTALMLTGCGSWKWFNDNKPALEFAVKVAVVDLIDQDKVDGDRVIEVAEVGAKFLDANPQAQAGEIIAAVNNEIKWEKLTAGQALLAESLLMVLQEKITADIEKGVVNADAKASVREIITWVKEAAMMAKARQPATTVSVDVLGSPGALASTETIILAYEGNSIMADRRPGV